MPPKSSKKGRNGFYYFMLDVRQEESDRGNYIKNMEDLTTFAGPLWRELSTDEKEHYNRRAKDEKLKGATDNERKFNSMGVSFAASEALDRELEEQLKIMKATIRNTVQSSSTEALVRKPFYFCHVNHYFKTDGDNYQPAEIAVAEFTLEDGVTDILHYILDPGKIPLGMKGDAQNWAEKTHGIRLMDKQDETVERERDYVKVFSAVVNFLKKGVGISQEGTMVLPVVYSMPDSKNNNANLSAVKCCMNFLSASAHENRDLFRVYPLPELFFNLRKKWGEAEGAIPSVSILENEIEKDVFSFASNLGCDYHELKDLSLHCSLSIVRRWVYTLCDHICHLAGVTMINGRHAPPGTDLTWSTVNTSKKTNLKAEVGYVEPSQSTSAPKFVDLPKMKELRIREREAVEEELSQAQSLPRPQKAVYRGGLPPPGLGPINDRDFPPIGGMGGGRGLPFFKVEPSVWPISGRGKSAK